MIVRLACLCLLGLVAVMPPAAGEPAQATSQVADTHQHTGRIVGIEAEFGNLNTTIGPAQMAALGITRGVTFMVRHRDTAFSVYLGETYSDVPRGDWIAFFNSEGKLHIARNFENAAGTLGATVNDTITISKSSEHE